MTNTQGSYRASYHNKQPLFLIPGGDCHINHCFNALSCVCGRNVIEMLLCCRDYFSYLTVSSFFFSFLRFFCTPCLNYDLRLCCVEAARWLLNVEVVLCVSLKVKYEDEYYNPTFAC